MTLWELILTHAACTVAGVFLGRWLVLRTIRPLIVSETRPMTSRDLRPPRSFWVGVVILVSSLMVIGIGIQARLASQDGATRDRTNAAYSQCLTKFANDLGAFANRLVATLDTRSRAIADLERARTLRENAVDRIIEVIIHTRTHPPTADAHDFNQSLAHFEKARLRLVKVQASVEATRRHNPIDTFKPPEVTCRQP